MRVQDSINIAAPPEKIWPFMVQPENILKWVVTLQKCELIGQQNSGVGMSFYVEEKAGGPLMKLKFQVTDWLENHRLAFKMISGNFVRAYNQNWTIEPA